MDLVQRVFNQNEHILLQLILSHICLMLLFTFDFDLYFAFAFAFDGIKNGKNRIGGLFI